MTSENIFERDFPVHYYETDMRGSVQPVALLNYLQDAAAGHARLLGVAVPDLMRQGLTWVLSRVHLRIERAPRGGETLTIRTWPSTREGVFSCREFELLVGGEAVARATSSWAVLDLASRRPVAINERLPAYPLVPRRALADDFSTLPRLGRADEELAFAVRRSDLDINRHVNNAVYAGWALDTSPEELAASHAPVELEIGFRAEALAGDTVLSRCVRTAEAGEPCLIHQLLNSRDGRELTRLRTRWRPVSAG